MTVTATLVLSAGKARKLADLIAEDETIGADAVDLNEVSPDRWRVVVYLGQPTPGPRAAVESLAGRVAGARAVPEWRTLAETDWVKASQAALPPVRAGRFMVHGAHDRSKIRPNDRAIAIEAAQAFGTGHHGTTRGCLVAIDAVARSRHIGSALDVGTGTGVLAIALAKLGVPAIATDIDPLAVAIARYNARANAVGRLVRIVPMPGIAGRLPRGKPRRGYDLIVANILMAPLLTLAPAIAQALAPGGVAILSGLTPDQRRRIVATYRGLGLTLVRATILDGWLTVVMERRRPGRAKGPGMRRGLSTLPPFAR